MITRIETALIERLKLGLGDLVTGVYSYGGELDEEGLRQVVQQLPACWVTFAGGKSETHNTARRQSRFGAEFVVLVAAHSSRSEQASRSAGINYWEIGSYDLIYGVRRLLAYQDLGLAIDPLRPTAVRTLFNAQLERNDAVSVFACHFETYWLEEALANGGWPELDNGQVVDARDAVLLRYRVPDAEPPLYTYYGASARDGGVRRKEMMLPADKWTLVTIKKT